MCQSHTVWSVTPTLCKTEGTLWVTLSVSYQHGDVFRLYKYRLASCNGVHRRNSDIWTSVFQKSICDNVWSFVALLGCKSSIRSQSWLIFILGHRLLFVTYVVGPANLYICILETVSKNFFPATSCTYLTSFYCFRQGVQSKFEMIYGNV